MLEPDTEASNSGWKNYLLTGKNLGRDQADGWLGQRRRMGGNEESELSDQGARVMRTYSG